MHLSLSKMQAFCKSDLNWASPTWCVIFKFKTEQIIDLFLSTLNKVQSFYTVSLLIFGPNCRRHSLQWKTQKLIQHLYISYSIAKQTAHWSKNSFSQAQPCSYHLIFLSFVHIYWLVVQTVTGIHWSRCILQPCWF